MNIKLQRVLSLRVFCAPCQRQGARRPIRATRCCLSLLVSCIIILNCVQQANAPTRPSANEPARIISLKPNITEILFALGVGNNVIGVTTWCDYPIEVKKLPKVADYININTEKIIALKPDLVIGSEENSIKNQFGTLQNAGINTLAIPFKTMNDLYSSIERIADIVGKKEAGQKIILKIKKDITTPTRSLPPRGGGLGRGGNNILILVGHRPLVAAGNNTFYGDILKLIGVKNIIDGTATPYPTINTEFILAKNPDKIIDLAMGSETVTDLPDAIKDKVMPFDISDFRAGPRIGEAAKRLKAIMEQ